MKNKIILHDYFGDTVTYKIKDLTIQELQEVFIRIARHMEYGEDAINEHLQSNPI